MAVITTYATHSIDRGAREADEVANEGVKSRQTEAVGEAGLVLHD